jgi:hypothetical protein
MKRSVSEESKDTRTPTSLFGFAFRLPQAPLFFGIESTDKLTSQSSMSVICRYRYAQMKGLRRGGKDSERKNKARNTCEELKRMCKSGKEL